MAWFDEPKIRLQFGHAREGVEIDSGSAANAVAEMTLQVGHAREGVEIPVRPWTCRRSSRCFNSATPVKAWR